MVDITRKGFFELVIVPREALSVVLTFNSDLPTSGTFWGDVRLHQDDASPQFSLTVTKTGDRTLQFTGTIANTTLLLTNSVYKGYLDLWHKDGTDQTMLAWTVFNLQPTGTSVFV